jgi:hypothetical protein
VRGVPRRVFIDDVEYSVKYRKNPQVDGKDCHGYCDTGTKEIVLQLGMTKQERKRVFIHECFHAVLFESGISYDWDDDFVDMIEEPVVDRLSRWVARYFS